MAKNQEALASAYKQIGIHLDKIEELDITADMDNKTKLELIKRLSEEKALTMDEGKDWKKYSKGQTFYVESLIKDAGRGPEELIEYHYKKFFSEVATEAEMLEQLNKRLGVTA